MLRLHELLGLGSLFAELFQISGQGLVVEDQSHQEGQGSDQYIHRHDQPEPGPVFDLTGKFAYRDSLKEAGSKQGQEITDGIVITGTPDVGGVFVADAEKFTPVTKGNEAQLGLEDLVEHNEQHKEQQTSGSAEDALVGNLVHAEQHHQQRNCAHHPVVIVEADNIQRFAQLIGLCQGFFGIEQGDQTADHTDVEHIVLDFLVLDPEEDGEQCDICTTDVDKPAVPEHSGLVHRVGRDIDLQKMQRKSDGKESEEPEFLGQYTFVTKTVINYSGQTAAKQKPKEVPTVKHTDDHICNLLYLFCNYLNNTRVLCDCQHRIW